MRIVSASEFSVEDFRSRNIERSGDVAEAVSSIIREVRNGGDSALFGYTEKFDGCRLDAKSLIVSKSEIDEAVRLADPKFLNVLENAYSNIVAFHSNQKRTGFISDSCNGMVTGQKVIALDRVAFYVPGGRASYPSSVLMNAGPAKVAGVRSVCIATPPGKDGKVNSDVLLAAYVSGVDRIYKMGGAQAIAALAYGTESVERVDKITGPGNAFVAEAKRQVFGQVAIDMIAGPSEILVIADESADPRLLAIDLLSQAEHDPEATAILITDSRSLADDCVKHIDRLLESLPKREIAMKSIESNGRIIIADSISSAIELADRIAPEHLELQVANPFDYLSRIRNAGSIFLGANTPEASGDYFAGANHVLPTSGTARFSSPLSVDDFLKKVQYTYYSAEAFSRVAEDIGLFARREGLEAHALSALMRLETKCDSAGKHASEYETSGVAR